MVATSTITDTQVRNFIIRAVRNVCATMLRQQAVFVESPADSDLAEFNARPHVFSSVGFVGEANGLVHLCIPEEFAKDAAVRLLGISRREIDLGSGEVVKDLIGEVTNMTVGGFKNALCDVGFPCRLTLPTIMRGDNLSVAAMKSSTRHIVHFDCAGHRLIVDIQMKIA